MKHLKALLILIRFLRAAYPRKRRATVTFRAPEDMPPQELLSAFAVPEKHPLWRAVHQMLDDAQAAKITDALDSDSHGEENSYRRGEANSLAEFKARLIEMQIAATRQKEG